MINHNATRTFVTFITAAIFKAKKMAAYRLQRKSGLVKHMNGGARPSLVRKEKRRKETQQRIGTYKQTALMKILHT